MPLGAKGAALRRKIQTAPQDFFRFGDMGANG
jgi:hypothetical protein